MNDIATAGGSPRWFLATLLLPETGITASEVASLFEEIRAACSRYGVTLVGGHTEVSSAVNRVVIAGSMIGEVADEDSELGEGLVLVWANGSCRHVVSQ